MSPWLMWLIVVVFKWLNPGYFGSYNYEVGQHYLEIIRLTEGVWLLDGPLTSHPWLRLSSLPYYGFFPIFGWLNFHPLALMWTWIGISALAVVINYLMIKKWFGGEAAIISSLLMLVGYNNLYFDSHIGFFNFIIPLMYGFVWLAREVSTGRQPGWKIILMLSVMASLHASAWVLLPIVGFLVWKEKRVTAKDWAALALPQLPLLIKTLMDQDRGLIYFLGWMPYRVWLFVTGKSLGVDRVEVADTTVVDLIKFVQQSVLPADWPWWTGLLVAGLVMAGYGWKRKTKMMRISQWWWLILITGMIGLLIHKNPPAHYFVSLVIMPPVLIGVLMAQLAKWPKIVLTAILVGVNLPYWWQNNRWINQQPINEYQRVVEISKLIAGDAGKRQFGLSRVGPFDDYPGQAKEQYEYMLRYMGAKINSGAELTYILVEGQESEFDAAGYVYLRQVGQIRVFKR